MLFLISNIRFKGFKLVLALLFLLATKINANSYWTPLPINLSPAILEDSIPIFKENQEIHFSLPDNELIRLKVKNISHHKNGGVTYVGSDDSRSTREKIILTFGKRRVFVTVLSPNELSSYVGVRGNDFKLKKIKPHRLLEKEVDGYKVLSSTTTSPSTQKYFSERQNTQDVIDLLVLKTNDTEVLYDNDADSRINQLVAVTNQILIDSGVNITLNLITIDLVEYDVISGGSALDDLYNRNHESFKYVSNRRYELGADLVILMHPFIQGDSVCGKAFPGGRFQQFIWDKESAYSYVAIDCEDYVMAHEIGHNLGLSHSRRSGDGFIAPYAVGYGIDDNFVTIMAYRSDFSNAPKLYLFSSPELDCNGSPCGVSRENSADGADAVYALNQAKQHVADYYHRNPILETLEQSFAKGVSLGFQECLLQQGRTSHQISDYSGGILEVDCSSITQSLEFADLQFFPNLYKLHIPNSNISELTNVENYDNLHDINFANNQLDDLTPLNQLVYMLFVDLSKNRIDDLTPLDDLVNISDLNLMDNNITDLQPIENLTNLVTLMLSKNQIEDISIIANFTHLESLRLADNQISDLSPLHNLNYLGFLYLENNQISNVSELSDLTSLLRLVLDGNQLTDVSPIFDIAKQSLAALSLKENSSIFCWQQDYLSSLFDEADFNRSLDCSLSDDEGDFDNDGISNKDEISANTDPTHFDPPSISTEESNSGGGVFGYIFFIQFLGLIMRRIRGNKNHSSSAIYKKPK